MTPHTPLLEVRNLSAAFDSESGPLCAVDNVSFSVRRGECLGIVGESGCGKSVTAMSLVRLLPQPIGRIVGGEVLFHGENILTMPPSRLRDLRGGQIGVIFQEPMNALNPTRTIGSQIAETIMQHRGCTADEAWGNVLELLAKVKIPSPEVIAESYPHTLSGGMQQRIVIAIALACKPELIIADEPTTALDVTVQHQILTLLRDMREDMGASSILITHDLGLIAQHCDRVIVMYAGRIVEKAEIRELFTNPCHAYTRALLSAAPRIEYPRKTYLPTIPGHVAAIRDYVPGCRFCQRLGAPTEELQQRPPMRQISPEHWAEACPYCCPQATR